jgi:prepilin-type N-terminal cleavage/methylation domain-containing protein
MNSRKSSGFSMIELMIAMAIGLVVIGSVLAFTLSSITTNTEYVQATRLSQELRNTMDFVSRELRRAGYDQNVGGYTAKFSTTSAFVPSPFARIYIDPDNDANGDGTVGDGCVIYAYDRSGGTNGVVDTANGEIRALRLATRTVDGLTVGVMEIAESASGVTPTCGGASPTYTNYPATCSSAGWCALSDPRVLNVTEFSLDTSGYKFTGGTTTAPSLYIREIGIDLRGQLRRSADGTVTRGIRSDVKIRADCLEIVTDDCKNAPTGT